MNRNSAEMMHYTKFMYTYVVYLEQFYLKHKLEPK